LVHFFNKGRGREEREYKTIFSSPNWRDLEGRGGKANHVITILIILTYLSSYLF
jgi:hypothetical protein